MDEDDIEYVRYYVSDRTSFKLVTDQLENKKAGRKDVLIQCYNAKSRRIHI